MTQTYNSGTQSVLFSTLFDTWCSDTTDQVILKGDENSGVWSCTTDNEDKAFLTEGTLTFDFDTGHSGISKGDIYGFCVKVQDSAGNWHTSPVLVVTFACSISDNGFPTTIYVMNDKDPVVESSGVYTVTPDYDGHHKLEDFRNYLTISSGCDVDSVDFSGDTNA